MSESDVVIVTGAAGNLGAALCAVLERRGWRVAPVARDAADLTDPEGAKAVAARTLAAFGRIDGLAHTVGGFAMGSIAEHGPELWDQMRRVNLLTTINMVRAVWPAMQAAGRGSLVAIGAQPALRAGAGMAAYAGAKAAVLRLIEAAAEEGKPHGIRANAVLPEHHRHPAEPRRHARRRPGQMGDAGAGAPRRSRSCCRTPPAASPARCCRSPAAADSPGLFPGRRLCYIARRRAGTPGGRPRPIQERSHGQLHDHRGRGARACR